MAVESVYSAAKSSGRPDIDQGYIFAGYRLPTPTGYVSVPIVVVTPTCDFYQPKAYRTAAVTLTVLPLSLLAGLAAEQFKLQWNPDGRRVVLTSSADRNKFQNFIRDLVNGNLASLHYLPPFGEHGPSFVSFDSPLSIHLTDFDSLEFLAAMRPPYREYLSTRFSTYYLRVGTSDFPEWIDQLLSEYSRTEFVPK